MDDKKEKLDQKFKGASRLTDEQKRQSEIKLLRDSGARDRIAVLVEERNRQLEAQKKTHSQQRKTIVADRVKKEVKSSPELKPPGMKDKRSVAARIASIKRDVDAKLQPSQASERSNLEKSYNQKIDQEIAAARALQKGRHLTQEFQRSRDR